MNFGGFGGPGYFGPRQPSGQGLGGPGAWNPGGQQMGYGAPQGYGAQQGFGAQQMGQMNPAMMMMAGGGMAQMGQMGQMGQMMQMMQMMMQMMRMMQQMQQMQQQMGGMSGQYGGMPGQGGGMPGLGQQMGGYTGYGGQPQMPPYFPPSFPYQGGFPGGRPPYYQGGNSGMPWQNNNGNSQNPGSVAGGYTGNSGSPGEGAQKAVQIAASQIGQNSVGLNLANYHSDGRQTNNCAEFVSSCLSDAGMFNKSGNDQDCNVSQFRNDLLKQGYHEVQKAQAQPGDVAIIGNSHTELVSAAGAQKAIGANGSSVEKVSQQSLNWAGGNVKYYHKG